MRIILKHVFSKQEGIVVIGSLATSQPITHLAAGEWLGVSAELGDYFEVLTKQGFGWVKKSDCQTSLELEMPMAHAAA
jgi:hypothetical protein